MNNLLFVTGDLNYTDGVTSHLLNLTCGLKNNKNFNLIILCTGGDSVNRFTDSGILVIEDNIFYHSDRSLKIFAAAIKTLIRMIRQYKINIIHSHNHYAANISYYASKFTGVNTVQTIHGVIPEGGFLKHFRAYKYISVNEDIKAYLLKIKIADRNDIHFINQGFRYNESIVKKTEGEIKVICASRLVYEKGVDLFIKAAKIVKSKFTGNIKFLIAGTGEYENELKMLARNIESEVIFLGAVRNLSELFSQTNIFVMPTRSASEGFPMTIVEAALTKNLIITSEFNFLGKTFKNNIDGYTFKIDNYKMLAEKLLGALHNPERVSQMTENFYNKAKTIFNSETMIQKHIEVYKECQKV